MSGSKLLWFEALAAFWRADLVRRIPGRIPARVGSEQGAYAAYAANGRWNAVHAKANAGIGTSMHRAASRLVITLQDASVSPTLDTMRDVNRGLQSDHSGLHGLPCKLPNPLSSWQLDRGRPTRSDPIVVISTN